MKAKAWCNLKMRSNFLTLLLLSVIIVLVGCAQKPVNEVSPTSPAAGSEGETDSQEPFTISMALNFDGKDIPKQGNPVQTAIEEYTNTKLDIQYNPGTQYQDKLSVLIASGDMPMVVASYGPPKQSYLLSAFENDVFWDITPYIKNYENLSSLNQVIYDNVAYRGKIYGLPRERPLARTAFIYRVDWLEKLGLPAPETVDQFYEMLKAFTENDPDGNNVKDTYGMSTWGVNTFGVFFGAPNIWTNEDGEFVRDVFHPGYMEGLKFERKLYEEGLIHPDFAIMDRPQFEGEFDTGKAGVIYNTTNASVKYEVQLKKTNPDTKLDFFSILSTDAGKRVAGAQGSNGILMFPKSSVKTEEDLRKILAFFDKLGEEQMANLLEWGIEGKHYEIKEGLAVTIDQDAYSNEVSTPYKSVLRVVATEEKRMPGDLNPLLLRELEVTKDNENYLVNDATSALVSPTYVERGAELEQLITDANIKFVMGRADEAEWKKEIDRWWKNGGEQIAKEYAEDWAKSQN